MGFDDGVSALRTRPDPETLEILIYGNRYGTVKSALYWIDAIRDHLSNWNDSLVDQISNLDMGTKQVHVGFDHMPQPEQHFPKPVASA